MSFTNNHTVYDIHNVKNALNDTPDSNIKSIPLNTPIYVKANKWEECLFRISQLCGSKWNKKRKLDRANLIYGETRRCDRAGKYEGNRTQRLVQKDSKCCGCTALLSIRIRHDNPEVCELRMTRPHVNHVCDVRLYTSMKPPSSLEEQEIDSNDYSENITNDNTDVIDHQTTVVDEASSGSLNTSSSSSNISNDVDEYQSFRTAYVAAYQRLADLDVITDFSPAEMESFRVWGNQIREMLRGFDEMKIRSRTSNTQR